MSFKYIFDFNLKNQNINWVLFMISYTESTYAFEFNAWKYITKHWLKSNLLFANQTDPEYKYREKKL